MAPGFWQTLISIAEVKEILFGKKSCKSKPMDQNSSCFAWQPGMADEVVTTERSHDHKFDKGTSCIVYFHTHVHVHIEKMGNLSNSKIKLYICDNKLRSCAQFAPRGKCAPGANLLHRICTTYKGGANSHLSAVS